MVASAIFGALGRLGACQAFQGGRRACERSALPPPQEGTTRAGSMFLGVTPAWGWSWAGWTS